MKSKCVIFGASKTGKVAQELLSKEFEIIGFVDNDSRKWGQEFCGKEIFNPDDLPQMKEIEIVIASVYYALIHKQLREMGIEKIQIFFYMGAATDNISTEYRLFQLSDTSLFEKCVFDKNRIERIERDFSENYSQQEKANRITLPDTDRKRVLFCAYIFPPIGGAGVQRSLKFVKYMRQFGYEPVILTVGENDGKLVYDETMLDEIPKDVTIVRVDNKVFLPEALSQEEQQEIYNLYCGVTQSEEWMKDYLEIIQREDARLIPDNRMIWVNECLKQIEQQLDLNEMDIIYTTGNPFSTYLIGYYIKKKYGIKWVQDYRDPWMTNQYYLDYYYEDRAQTFSLQKQLEKKLAEFSDSIIVVSEKIIKDFTENLDCSDRIVEITNGYDEADFALINTTDKKNSKFTLCYNGSIYIDRSPLELLNFITELIDERRIESNRIAWIFNGTVEERWRRVIDEADKYKVVRYNGYLSHLNSIESAMQSDMLVLYGAKGEGAKIVMTGKVFEYIRMKTPVLSFSSKGGALDKILDETQTGKNFEYGDGENIKNYILECYEKWEKDNNVLCVNDDAIHRYSREYTTKLLADVFDKILEE